MSTDKTEWSDINGILEEKQGRETAKALRTSGAPAPDSAPSEIISLVAPLQDQKFIAMRDEANGLLARFKAKAIRRDAAMEGLKKVVSGQLQVLEHYVTNAVTGEKSKSDLHLQEYLAELDSEHLRILGQFDVKNLEQRARTIADLNDRFVRLVKEAREKDWPPFLIHETMKHLTELRARIVTQILEDFSARHQASS